MRTEAKAETEKIELTEDQRSLNRAIHGLLDCVAHMLPSGLAELVDDWSDNPRTLPLAQIALNEGSGNCGPMELAEYVASRERRSSQVLREWHEAGLVIEPIVYFPEDNYKCEQLDALLQQVRQVLFGV